MAHESDTKKGLKGEEHNLTFKEKKICGATSAQHEISPYSRWSGMSADKVSLSKTHSTLLPVHSHFSLSNILDEYEDNTEI